MNNNSYVLYHFVPPQMKMLLNYLVNIGVFIFMLDINHINKAYNRQFYQE